MSGLRRAFRHPDRLNDPHARAHGLVSDSFLGPLDTPDATWLAVHLDGCPACRQVAAAWAADRAALRERAAAAPSPPRDLGARLAAALDAEELRLRRAGRATRPAARRVRGRRPSRAPALAMAVVAAAAVVALVVLPVVAPLGGQPRGSAGPAATPIEVAGALVTWARPGESGGYVLDTATIDRVCPGGQPEACGTLDEGARAVVAFDVLPSQVILPKRGDQAIAVGATGLYAFAMPGPGPGVTSAPGSPSHQPTLELPTPTAAEVSTSPPVDTPAPSDSATPRTTPGAASPSSSPAGTPHPPTTTAPGSTAETSPGRSVATLPAGTPAPVAATALAIVEDVILAGGDPAYSEDGEWLAFSARPASGSAGPDLYVWQAGDERARRLTDDGATVFSGWIGTRILASRVEVVTSRPAATGEPAATDKPVPSKDASPAPTKGAPAKGTPTASSPSPGDDASPAPSEVAPPATAEPESPVPAETPATASSGPEAPAAATDKPATQASSAPEASGPEATRTPTPAPQPRAVAFSFLVDPASGEVEPIARPGIWRPVVDPSGTTAIFYTGRFTWSAEQQSWVPSSGRLVMADWADVVDPERALNSTAIPGRPGRSAKALDWEVRWEGSGRHVVVWIAEEGDASAGQLTLYDTIEHGHPAEALLDEVAALPGFSVDEGRLVWATPSGQNGKGSLIGVFAWNGAEPGAVYSAPQPGPGPLIIAR